MTKVCPQCDCKVIWDEDCPECDGSQQDDNGADCEVCEGTGYHDGYCECSECGHIDMDFEFDG